MGITRLGIWVLGSGYNVVLGYNAGLGYSVGITCFGFRVEGTMRAQGTVWELHVSGLGFRVQCGLRVQCGNYAFTVFGFRVQGTTWDLHGTRV